MTIFDNWQLYDIIISFITNITIIIIITTISILYKSDAADD